MRARDESGARGRLERLRAGWMRFWFAPGDAFDLGMSRVVCCAIFTHTLLLQRHGLAARAEIAETFWQPTPLFALLNLQALSPDTLRLLGLVCAGALVAATIGVSTRASCALAALLTFYLLGQSHCLGKVNHSDTVIPIIMAVLAVARSGDACSLDSLLGRASGSMRTMPHGAPPAGEYTWPVRTVWLLTALVFFAAGIAKLRHSGLDWVFSDNMRETLIGQHYVPGPPRSTLGLRIAEHHVLCTMMAAGVLAAETLAPLALFSSIARAVVIPVLVVFLLNLQVLFGFSFTPFFGMLAFWLPWSRLVAIARAPQAPRRPPRATLRRDPLRAPRT